MAVPYTFANATVSIPLSQLDSNFETAITLGNTAIQLGNTVTTLNNMTLANVTISSGNVTITNVSVTNVNATTVDTTNIEVTNVKSKDGTAGMVIADSTGDVSFSSTGALTVSKGTTAQRPGTPSEGMFRYNSDNDEFEGYSNGSWGSVGGGFYAGLFSKADPTIVAWTKTGAFTVTTATTLYVEVNGTAHTIASGASVTMPGSATAGTDYAIWCKTDGTLEATTNHTSPPSANARKVGGFHYAPGGNASGTSGGDTTPAINAYSFWDLKWRPTCSDPRGMTLVGGGYWMDIYLTGVDAITNGSSKYNVTMADGSSPPKIPTMFGGNGSSTYGSYTWFEAMELATAFGKRCPTQQEFMSAMYGTTEASSVGSDQGSTVLNAAYTSKWGVIQSTGVLWIWARDRGGAYNTGGWNANTEGRGSEYNAPNAAVLGGAWYFTSLSGSRSSDWASAASLSDSSIGSRFCCDHLQLD